MAHVTRSIRLQCNTGVHFKQYCIFELNDRRIEVHYGRTGRMPQRHIYNIHDSNYKTYEELIRAKTRRGRHTGTYVIADRHVSPSLRLKVEEEDERNFTFGADIPKLTNVFNKEQMRTYLKSLFQVEEVSA